MFGLEITKRILSEICYQNMLFPDISDYDREMLDYSSLLSEIWIWRHGSLSVVLPFDTIISILNILWLKIIWLIRWIFSLTPFWKICFTLRLLPATAISRTWQILQLGIKLFYCLLGQYYQCHQGREAELPRSLYPAHNDHERNWLSPQSTRGEKPQEIVQGSDWRSCRLWWLCRGNRHWFLLHGCFLSHQGTRDSQGVVHI